MNEKLDRNHLHYRPICDKKSYSHDANTEVFKILEKCLNVSEAGHIAKLCGSHIVSLDFSRL